jgi:hypothetical protein
MIKKNKPFVFVALLSIIFTTCEATKPLSTATIAPSSTPPPTLTATRTSTPTQTSTPTYLSTFTPPPIATTLLPEGWRIDEYPTGQSFPPFMGDFHDKYSFDWNTGFRTGFGTGQHYAFINGQVIQAKENLTTDSNNNITNINIIVNIENTPVFSVECDPKKTTFWERIISIWTFDNHWVLELFCAGRQDIILDGQSLNTTNGYSDSFSPYLISGKLFFFFKRYDKVGFYFDGSEYLLNYNDILYHYCCGIADFNPTFYKDQVHFSAVRGGIGDKYTDQYNYRYDVFMGILDLP